MKNKKAFTLIELIAVLVILAILALIVTPLVLNIIRKAKTAADRRSVDAYGRSVELAIASYTMDTGYPPTNLDNLEVEYTGKEVVCRVKQMKENGGLYMSKCSVNGKEVKDSKTDDGYYHYGTRDITNEEYIDMYGDALKKASVKYLEDNGNIVSDYKALNIDYTGKEVACSVTINYDGSVYLTNCKVNDESILDNNNEDGYYHYGENHPYKTVYNIGDQVTYNGMDFYVIKDTDDKESNVILLKSEVLTADEINTYSIGTGAHLKGNGGIEYGPTKLYSESYVKATVDAWAQAKILDGLQEVRLITYEELLNNLGYNYGVQKDYGIAPNPEYTPNWVYNSNYSYWTMSYLDNMIWINSNNAMKFDTPNSYNNFVRPVIVLSKSVLN